MKPPLRFALGNLVWPGAGNAPWALYRLEMDSYEGLSVTGKLELLASVAGWAHGAERDFTLLRVTRAWSSAEYRARAAAGLDPRFGLRAEHDAWLAAHERRLALHERVRPELYLCVSLAAPGRGLGPALATALREPWTAVRRTLGWDDPRTLTTRALRAWRDEEERACAHVCDFFLAERCGSPDLQWLVRRAFCRGVGEPELDPHWRPQALVLEQGEELSYEPLEADVLRLLDSPIAVRERSLEIRGEAGTSHQALLVLGALPESVPFPGAGAELLFAPLEDVAFGVDAAVSCRWVANADAAALVRRRVVDADNIFREESHGDHGASPDAAKRPAAARALEDYLTGDGRPPLLRATISLAVGAPTQEELEERVAQLRRAYGAGLRLHRPLGEQVRLFREHFPAQGTQVPDYADYLLLEQLGAMVPTATHAVGSDSGPYLGHTLSGGGAPVLLDLTEASRTSRPPSVLLAGTLGSGKTMALQLLLYGRFLAGSRIVDIDPKGDHRLDDLPGMAGHVETVELGPDPAFRGLLDPLRVAPPGTQEELATSFLLDVIGSRDEDVRLAIREAVKDVVAHSRARGRPAHCGHVVARLEARREPAAQRAARALRVYADTGLAQLGFGSDEHEPRIAGERAVTSLRIRNLPRPAPGTPKDELREEERIGQAVLRLVAAYAMRLMGDDRSRHKVLGFDEAWFLLEDSAGRRLIEHLNRWGRSENATPLLVTHLVRDAEAIDNLIGVRLVFGQESEREARGALCLLRLGPDDERLRSRLLSFRRGRCYLRDLEGRVASIQVDPGPELLRALDTTPGVRAGTAS